MNIEYPSNFDTDDHADRRAQREEAILHSLDIGDILAEVDSLIATEPDPTQHPCYQMVAVMLNQKLAASGAQLYDSWKALCATAIKNLIDQAISCD